MDFLFDTLKNNTYPGRGIFVGKSEDGKSAVFAYFIMGRSESSRNRYFISEKHNGIKIKLAKPIEDDTSLILYSPVKSFGRKHIISNGTHGDIIYDYLKNGKTFEDALRTCTYEPDEPHYTPRIAAYIAFENNDMRYKMAIVKKSKSSDVTERAFFEYKSVKEGTGHLMHTYECNGVILPPFKGSPRLVKISGDIHDFTEQLWNSLNEENKISLFTRYVDLQSGSISTEIINKYNYI